MTVVFDYIQKNNHDTARKHLGRRDKNWWQTATDAMGKPKSKRVTASSRNKMIKEISASSYWRIVVLSLGNKQVCIGFAPLCIL